MQAAFWVLRDALLHLTGDSVLLAPCGEPQGRVGHSSNDFSSSCGTYLSKIHKDNDKEGFISFSLKTLAAETWPGKFLLVLPN